jgi:hypothetical protein
MPSGVISSFQAPELWLDAVRIDKRPLLRVPGATNAGKNGADAAMAG